MLWGDKQKEQFRSIVKPGYAKKALGFNEPDIGSQSLMSPTAGVQLWREYMQPLKASGYTLISPAVTSGPTGRPWLSNFIAQCTGCSIDAIAVHWYGTDAQVFIKYLQETHAIYGRPLYVTEFACQNFTGGAQCSADQIWSFMRTVTAFMDNTSWVVAYYAFGVMHDMGNVNYLNQLMAGNGGPTPLGFEYIN
jgi:O-glycosyl hydrolase